MSLSASVTCNSPFLSGFICAIQSKIRGLRTYLPRAANKLGAIVNLVHPFLPPEKLKESVRRTDSCLLLVYDLYKCGSYDFGVPTMVSDSSYFMGAVAKAYYKCTNKRTAFGYVPFEQYLKNRRHPRVPAAEWGVDEPADPLYLLSEEFEGAVTPWGDSEQRTYFWTLLSDGSLVTVSVDHNETGHQNNLLECRTAGGEGFYWNAFNDDQLIGNGTWKFIRAGMQDYLYEGAFISTKEHWQPYTWYSERTGSQTEGTERRRTVITGTAAAEWLQGETAEERIELEGPVTLMNHSITYTTYEAGVPQAVYTNAAGEAVYNRYRLADGRTAASDDTLPVLVTDDGYEAGSNIGFSDLEFDEDERFTPYSSLQPIE